jgi:oligopeptide transport system permease protein
MEPQLMIEASLTTPAIPGDADAGVSLGRAALRRFLRNRLAILSCVVLAVIAGSCLLLPFMLPYSSETADFANMAAPIKLFSAHPFGTDSLGRDLLARVLEGGQMSLALGFFGAIVSVAISVVYGATAGYLGGWVDAVMMRAVDVLLSVPFMFLVIVLNVVLGKTNMSLFLAVVIGLWLTPSVIARGQAVSLRGREFIEAARAGGMKSRQIIFRHIIPNSLNVVIVYSSLLVLEAMLTESFLSFLGLGVQPPAASWGTLISEGAQQLDTDPRLLLLPGTMLALTLICLNYITDGLRDAFDPHEN